MSRFETAKTMYAEIGVDAEAALEALQKVRISMHCWQGDDVSGFENSGSLDGGIAATGNYPGKARNPRELFADIDTALSLIPGDHKVNVHACYAVTDRKVDRDALGPEHFAAWVEFARDRNLGLDFNPTFFSHPKAADSLTLSHPDAGIRRFWVEHGKACRRITEYFGRELGMPSLNNVWIPDGYKNIPSDRLGPRARLKDSLDELFSEKLDPACIVDSVESKVFGLGLESYTVGSHEFYLNYANRRDVLCLLDSGHFHPTETVSDKISSMLLFFDRLALHVSRPVRWDSDHVVLYENELQAIAGEIVGADALGRVIIGMDFFDASINRISAWVVGMRNMQKALLFALLQPHAAMAELQNAGDFTRLMVEQEELKMCPLGDIWDEFCLRNDVPPRSEWFPIVREYKANVLSQRT